MRRPRSFPRCTGQSVGRGPYGGSRCHLIVFSFATVGPISMQSSPLQSAFRDLLECQFSAFHFFPVLCLQPFQRLDPFGLETSRTSEPAPSYKDCCVATTGCDVADFARLCNLGGLMQVRGMPRLPSLKPRAICSCCKDINARASAFQRTIKLRNPCSICRVVLV